MSKIFMSMEYEHIIGGNYHYYWVSYGEHFVPIVQGCRAKRPVVKSMMTRILRYDEMNMINPEEFFNYCCDEKNGLSKVLFVRNDAAIVLPEKGWKILRCNGFYSWDYEWQAEMLDRFATPDYPNLVIFSKNMKPSIIPGSKDELEEKRNSDIENERYDDYWYKPDEEGNMWCDGISLKEDMDSCEAWQERDPEGCRECSRLCRVIL